MRSARRAGTRAAIVLTVVGVSAALLSGCGFGSPTAESASLPPITYVAPQPSAPFSHAAPQEGVAAVCSAPVQHAVDEVIDQQLAAFRARDFDAAFALASEQFRAITDAEGLRRLISKGHPEVLNSVSHELAECRSPAPDLVVAAVRVTGANGKSVVLLYQFTLEHDEWRILQSAPITGHGQQEAPSDGVVEPSSA